MAKIFKLNSQTVSPGQKLIAKSKKVLFPAFEFPSPYVKVSWDLQTQIIIIIIKLKKKKIGNYRICSPKDKVTSSDKWGTFISCVYSYGCMKTKPIPISAKSKCQFITKANDPFRKH